MNRSQSDSKAQPIDPQPTPGVMEGSFEGSFKVTSIALPRSRRPFPPGEKLWVWTADCYPHPHPDPPTRYTPERGYGLDLSGLEPVWRGKRPGWNKEAASSGWDRHPRQDVYPLLKIRGSFAIRIPRYRIDDYIKKGLIDPARRAYL